MTGTHRQRHKRDEAELMQRVGSRASYYQMLAMAYHQCLHDQRLLHLLPAVNEAFERYSKSGDKIAVVETMRLIAEVK